MVVTGLWLALAAWIIQIMKLLGIAYVVCLASCVIATLALTMFRILWQNWTLKTKARGVRFAHTETPL